MLVDQGTYNKQITFSVAKQDRTYYLRWEDRTWNFNTDSQVLMRMQEIVRMQLALIVNMSIRVKSELSEVDKLPIPPLRRSEVVPQGINYQPIQINLDFSVSAENILWVQYWDWVLYVGEHSKHVSYRRINADCDKLVAKCVSPTLKVIRKGSQR